MTRFPIISALALAALLAGCGGISDLREMRRLDRAFALPDPAPQVAGPSAGAAETACLEAGRAAGFDVQRVVGTTEVMGTQGLADSRDVMLAVRRGGQSFEVRCSYSYATNAARIMTL